MPITISDTSSAVSLSQVASTLPHLRKVVQDNVSDQTPLLSFLMGSLGASGRAAAGMDGGALPGAIVGGRDIHVPVQLDDNETVGSYSGADTIDISLQDTDNYALFAIRQNAGSFVITGREKRGNKGEAAIYNLMQGKINRLVNDLRIDLNRQAVADGTGNGGKDLDGLGAVIGTGALAGLDPATFPKWQPGGFASGNARHGIIGATTLDLVRANQFRCLDNPGPGPDQRLVAPELRARHGSTDAESGRHFDDFLEARDSLDVDDKVRVNKFSAYAHQQVRSTGK